MYLFRTLFVARTLVSAVSQTYFTIYIIHLICSRLAIFVTLFDINKCRFEKTVCIWGHTIEHIISISFILNVKLKLRERDGNSEFDCAHRPFSFFSNCGIAGKCMC